MQGKLLRWDFFLILGVLALAGILLIFTRGGKGESFSVQVDGGEVLRASLTRDAVYTLKVEDHSYELTVQDGRVAMTHAECPDQTCVRTGAISQKGQRIVCLPRRLVVQIIGEAELDGVAR